MSMGSGPHVKPVASDLERSTVCRYGMNAPDTSAGGGPSQPQPRPEDEVATAALPETAAEAEPAIPGLAERAIARWENEGGRVRG